MLSGTLQRGLSRAIIGTVVGLSAAVAFTACGSGSTDGGASGPQVPGTGNDSTSLGKLSIILNDARIPTGTEVGFRVKLTDKNGQALKFTRINCESEKGIAIIEPSAGGVAFESTDENGELSGRLGGVAPGSYLIECRAPQGFNLYDRETLIIEGSVPQGFTGWPGAAGGNLGGGTITDPDPGSDGGEGIRISSVTFEQDGRTGTVGTIDSTGNCNCAGVDPSTATSVTREPFGGARVKINIQNGTNAEFRVDQVSISGMSATPLGNSGNTVVIPSDGSATITLFAADATGSCTVAAISTPPVLTPTLTSGTAVVTVSGTSGSSDVVLTKQESVSVRNIDNCSSSS